MKVFLSHPMHGKSGKEIEAIRNEAVSYLMDEYPLTFREGKFEIIDNVHHVNPPANAGRLWHLGRSIQQMGEADCVYFCDGWEDASGCLIERDIAKYYGLLIIE